MFNANYFPGLRSIRGLAGDYEVMLNTGEILNVSSNPKLAQCLARSLDLALPRAESLASLVRSACEGSKRALTLLDRMDWHIWQLTSDDLPLIA